MSDRLRKLSSDGELSYFLTVWKGWGRSLKPEQKHYIDDYVVLNISKLLHAVILENFKVDIFCVH